MQLLLTTSVERQSRLTYSFLLVAKELRVHLAGVGLENQDIDWLEFWLSGWEIGSRHGRSVVEYRARPTDV